MPGSQPQALSPSRKPVTVDWLVRVLKLQEHNLAELERWEDANDVSAKVANTEALRYRRPLLDLLELADVRRFKQACEAAGCAFDAKGTSQWVAQVGRDNRMDPRAVEELSLDEFCDLARNNDPPTCYVTLLQMAGIVSRDKRTLERLAAKSTFPSPAVEGGGGKPHEWRWSDVRPILESEYGRPLPEVFPADRFVR